MENIKQVTFKLTCRPPDARTFLGIFIFIFPGLDMMVRSWFLGQREGTQVGGSRGADWKGYGWLAEEGRNRRKTEEKGEKGGRDFRLERGASREELGEKNRGKEKEHPQVRVLNHSLFAIDILLDHYNHVMMYSFLVLHVKFCLRVI